MILTKSLIINKGRGLPRNMTIKDLDQIKTLNLWGQNISNVSILEELPQLQVVSLAVNNIRELAPFASLKYLRELYLRKNLVTEPSQLLHLTRVNLTHLWIEDNPVCNLIPNYRITIVRLLPNLQRLDDIEVKERERREARSLGSISDRELNDIFRASNPHAVDMNSTLRPGKPPRMDESVDRDGHTHWQYQQMQQRNNDQSKENMDDFPAQRRQPINSLPANFNSANFNDDLDMSEMIRNRNSQKDLTIKPTRFEEHLTGSGVIEKIEWSNPTAQLQRRVGVKNEIVGGNSDPSYDLSYRSPNFKSFKSPSEPLEDDRSPKPHLNVRTGTQVINMYDPPKARIPHADIAGVGVKLRNGPPEHLTGASPIVEERQEIRQVRRLKGSPGLGHVRGSGALVDNFPVMEAHHQRLKFPNENVGGVYGVFHNQNDQADQSRQRNNWSKGDEEDVLNSIRVASASRRNEESGRNQNADNEQSRLKAVQQVEDMAKQLLKAAEALDLSIILGIMDEQRDRIQIGGQGRGRAVLDKLKSNGLELSDVFAACAVGNSYSSGY